MPWRPVLRGHELLPERAVRRGADGQLPRPSVTSDVDRLAPKQRANAVEQGQSEESDPIPRFGHHRCGHAVGQWGLGDRCGQPIVGDGEFEHVHAGEGRAPHDDLTRVDAGLFNGPADDGAVVLALPRDGQHLAWLPARTAEVAVVEGDRGEALVAEAFGERSQSSRLDAADAVGHDHGRVRAAALGPVHPRFNRVTRRRRDLHGNAPGGRVVGDRYGHRRLPCEG